MRTWKAFAAAGVVALAAALGAGAPRAEATDPIILKRFLLGYLEGGTGRFVATGARGVTNAFRDNVVLMVFTAPVDFSTVDDRTIQIGIPTSTGLRIPAKGAFSQYRLFAFDPISGSYEVKRTYRNRILFDPTDRWDPVSPNPWGFDANTLYSVTIPGADTGATRTVRSRHGSPMQATFTTTFTTTDRFVRGWYW